MICPGAVDVAEERLQRPHPLGEPGGEARPVVGGDDARHEVEREQPVGRAVADPERDAARPLLGVQRGLGRGQPAVAHAAERAEHPAVLGPHLAVGADRLVVAVGVVGREEIGPRRARCRAARARGRAPWVRAISASTTSIELTATAERAALAGGGAARRRAWPPTARGPAPSRPPPPGTAAARARGGRSQLRRDELRACRLRGRRGRPPAPSARRASCSRAAARGGCPGSGRPASRSTRARATSARNRPAMSTTSSTSGQASHTRSSTVGRCALGRMSK